MTRRPAESRVAGAGDAPTPAALVLPLRVISVLPSALVLASLLPFLVVLLLVPAASAQTAVSGQLDFGARLLAGDDEAARFLEYRDIPQGMVVSGAELGLEWEEPGYFVNLRARDPLERDASIRIEAGRRGRYELELGFERVPHLLTTTARSLLAEDAPGVLTLSDDARAALATAYATDVDPMEPGTQRDLAAIQALVQALSRPVGVSARRERSTATLRVTPTPDWELDLRYERSDREGYRPLGSAFGFDVNELLEPIDHSSHEVGAGVERSGAGWSVRADYSGSFFRNAVDALVWDNPLAGLDGVAGPATGRIDLYPDNDAHQGSLSAVFSLPLAGRLATTAAYGAHFQDDRLLPFTTNASITDVPDLPAPTADAEVRTLLLTSSLSLRPSRTVSLRLGYRYRDRDNRTPRLLFTDYVRTDQRLSGTARVNLPFAHTRRNASAKVTWRAGAGVTLTTGYEWEGWSRDFRETLSTSENGLSAAADATPRSWLSLRASLERSERTGADEYDALRVHLAGFPGSTEGDQLAALRKYDQAERSRTVAGLLARVTLSEIQATARYDLTRDAYDRSAYGLRKATRQVPALELGYGPAPFLTVFLDYAWSDDRMDMRSRQRSPTSDDPDNDWVSALEDETHTYGLGILGEIGGPDERGEARLSLDLRYHRSDGTGRTTAFAPGSGDLVTAVDYPQVERDRQQLQLAARYRLTSRAALRLEYRYEKYDQADFALDPMAPFMGLLDPGSVESTWLGVTRPGFGVHLFELGLSLRG